MKRIISYIKKVYKENDDLIIRKLYINKKKYIYLVFFESLCNSENIYYYIIKRINDSNKFSNLLDLIDGPKITQITSLNKIFYFLENSYAIVISNDQIIGVEVKAELDRGITSSLTEPNMYGPKDSFCENYQKNLGLIKRRIKDDKLVTKSFNLGSLTKTKVSYMYIENLINDKQLLNFEDKFKSIKKLNIIDAEGINKSIYKDSFFPTVLKTEKPALVAKYLLMGRIIILTDNSPFALILNCKLSDFVNPNTNDSFIKILRYICFFLTIFTPAMYISLINFNQESIPPSLLVNFCTQRSGVPFPAIIECILMLFICEILRESDIRFPSNYGSAASILGALILGEAAVSAGIVSPIMIIVISVTFITNLIFTEINFVKAIRVTRFFTLILSSFLGLYALNILIIVFLFKLNSISESEDYL